MRVYEGSPRQDYEEVLRSIGAILDQRGMREISISEVPEGFLVQGLTASQGGGSAWSDTLGQLHKESISFVDDDIARFMEEGLAQRSNPSPAAGTTQAGNYEHALRVIGHYIDQQRPKDVFLFEQEGAYVLRLLMASAAGVHHMLVEFTRDEIDQLIAQGGTLRFEAAQPSQTGT
jgi:hypothetical protein